MSAAKSALSWLGRRFIAFAVFVSALVLAGALIFADRAAENTISRVDRDATFDALAALSEIARDEGPDALRQALAIRSRLGGDNVLHLLIDKNGAVVDGDIVRWPAEIKADNTWTAFNFVWATDGKRDEAVGVAATLPNGERLLLARDLASQRQVRASIVTAFFWALLAAMGATLALGLWLDRIVMSHVSAMAHTASEVVAGRLNARAPVGEERGELAGLARTMNAMLDRIEELMTGLRVVTDSLAHDLRTPLTRLKTALERAEQQTGAAHNSSVGAALTEARNLDQTFTALIDIARAETGLSREAMGPTNLADMVEDLCELFGPSAEEKNLTLQAVTQPVEVNGHRALLAQALGNLLDNAIKYSPPGGDIEVSLARRGQVVEICVADRGPGIPPAERAEAVARFGRLARDANAPGSGLGLSIAAAAARLHGGALLLEDNAPGLRAILRLRT